MQPKTGFAPVPLSCIVGCDHPEKLKIERRQKSELQENQCAYFHDSCSWRHFDSPATLRMQFHIWCRG